MASKEKTSELTSESVIVDFFDHPIHYKNKSELEDRFERFKPVIFKLEKRFTAESVIALMYLQEQGESQVPEGNIQDLIEARLRGLETLGVKDFYEELYLSTAKYMMGSYDVMRKRIKVFWRNDPISLPDSFPNEMHFENRRR